MESGNADISTVNSTVSITTMETHMYDETGAMMYMVVSCINTLY